MDVLTRSQGVRLDFSGRVFRVAAMDLFTAPVDCLVNAANVRLAHGGGVAGLFARKAGKDLVEESDAIVRARGPLKVSDAVLTTAGNLPYKGVIHVVGPQASENDVPGKLARAIGNALLLAEKSGYSSIAFPAVSTGIFGVDKETCAKAIFDAVAGFFGERKETTLREAWLCLMPEDYPVFEAYFASRR